MRYPTLDTTNVTSTLFFSQTTTNIYVRTYLQHNFNELLRADESRVEHHFGLLFGPGDGHNMYAGRGGERVADSGFAGRTAHALNGKAHQMRTALLAYLLVDIRLPGLAGRLSFLLTLVWNLRNALGQGLQLHVRRKDHLPLTKRGRFRCGRLGTNTRDEASTVNLTKARLSAVVFSLILSLSLTHTHKTHTWAFPS